MQKEDLSLFPLFLLPALIYAHNLLLAGIRTIGAIAPWHAWLFRVYKRSNRFAAGILFVLPLVSNEWVNSKSYLR